MCHIRINESFARFFILLASSISLAYSAPFVCTPTAVPALVRGEGLAERMGDILISCTGGPPGGVVGGNLTVFLNVNVTNKLINNFTDADDRRHRVRTRAGECFGAPIWREWDSFQRSELHSVGVGSGEPAHQ
jgi:hypothetical protein